MLQDRDECELRLSMGTRGFTMQAAYAITDKYALLLDARRSSYKQGETNYNGEASSRQHREQTILAGMGRFASLGKHNKGCWALYGGASFGNSSDTPLTGTLYSKADAKYWQAFLQPQIGFAYKIVEGTLSLRNSYTMIHNAHVDDPRYYGKHFDYLTLEPAITLGLGYDPVKFFAQGGLTFGGGDDFTKTTDALSSRLNMTLGLKIEIR